MSVFMIEYIQLRYIISYYHIVLNKLNGIKQI